MFKKIFTIIFIISAVFLGINNAEAAGKAMIYFEPTAKTVKVGDSFNITVMIDPQGEKIDTVRVIANFPKDKLEVVYFNLNGVFTTTAPGNYFDNNKGIISEGAAILGGQATQKAVFGTITFKALKEGQAQITLNSSSKLISSGAEKINLTNLSKSVISINSGAERAENSKQVIVNSPLQSNQEKWYNINAVNFSWQAEGGKVASYYYDFDQNPETDPTIKISSTENSKEFKNINSGIWYFHIKALYDDKTFSEVAHYQVMIDTVEPQKIEPIFENAMIAEGDDAILKFATSDQPSGIDYYNVSIDGGDFSEQTSPFIIKDLKIGEHIATVQAVDKAGNLIANAAKINVVEKTVEIGAGKAGIDWMKYAAWAGIAVLVIFAGWWITKRKKGN